MLRPKISIEMSRGMSSPLAQTSSAVNNTASTAAPAWNQPRRSGFGPAGNAPTVVCICRVIVAPLRRQHEQPCRLLGGLLDLAQQAATDEPTERPDDQPVEAEAPPGLPAIGPHPRLGVD